MTVIDPPISAETAAAALKLYRDRLADGFVEHADGVVMDFQMPPALTGLLRVHQP